MTTLSTEQNEALKLVRHWMKDKDQQVFRLFGYAGTGKTTLAQTIARETGGKVVFGAFTGKAASVMRHRGCEDARTIHSMIYHVEEGDNGDPLFFLKDKEDSELDGAKLVIIDECSMVDEELARDLMSFRTKILVLGDPAQLPPVKGTGFFMAAQPDAMLTQVHRQARDNPIIALSMMVREGQRLPVGTHGPACQVVKKRDITPEQVTGADQVLVGLNRTRARYNERIRELLGYTTAHPSAGEKLVCLRNDRKKALLNGSLWRVRKFRALQKNTFSLSLAPLDDDNWSGKAKRVKVRGEFFTGGEEDLDWTDLAGTQQFTYGYALTCHKAQGSQWDHVVVFDESYCFREESSRWLYTAITRAAEGLVVAL